jgi:hypothetical protein
MKEVMPFGRKCLILLACCWACLQLPGSAADRDPPVMVELTSGRQFTGQLHPRSDADKLWLRFGHDSAYILRPIDWDRITQVTIAGKRVSLPQFRREAIELERVPNFPADADRSAALLPPPENPPVSSPAATVALSDGGVVAVAPEPSRYVARVRVTSIMAEARVANWDRDVENDGLVVSVVPLDADGRAVAASGSLQVCMIGPRVRKFQEAPRSRGSKLDRLGRWVRAMRASDFFEGGFAYRLPFRATHPEFDNRLGSHALVNVKLTVPGSGTFERTIDYVRIRPFSPLRDYYQLHTGRRWLAVEQTGRGKPATGQPWYTHN